MIGPSPFDVADGSYLHALRLLRLVRVRRGCRALLTIVIIALPSYLALGLTVQALTPTGSPTWNFVDNVGGLGFLVFAELLAAGIIGALVVRFATGRTGRIAAAFVPILRRAREFMIDDRTAMRGLLPRLNKRQPFAVGFVLILMVVVGIGAIAAVNVVPAYQANHGRGGPVVTMGTDAFISSVDTGGRTPTYDIRTPYGIAQAEDRQPQDGQRWVVLPSDSGNGTAYLIGGHDYLLVGFILIVMTIAFAGWSVAIVFSIRREHRRRVAAGHVPLLDAVRPLVAGARPVITFDRKLSATIGLPALPHDSAAAWFVRRYRRGVTVTAGSITAVLVLIAVVIAVYGPRSMSDTDGSLPDVVSGTLVQTRH